MRRLIVFGVAVMVMLMAGRVGAGCSRDIHDYVMYPDSLDDEQTSLFYDAWTGTLEVNAPASTALTSINVNSAGSLFVAANFDQSNFDGSFDTTSAGNFFKATFGGSFTSFVVGEGVLPAGMSPEAILADLGIGSDDTQPTGSLDGGGGLGCVDLVYPLPEPSSLLLALLGILGLLHWRR